MAKSKKQIPAVEQLSEAIEKQLQTIADAVGCDKTMEELAAETTAYSSSKIISERESALRDGASLSEAKKPYKGGLCVDYDPVEDVASRTRIYDADGNITYDSLEDCNPQEVPHPEISPLTKEEESISETIPRFRPRDCVQCTAMRPTRSSYSRVYCTKGNTRYIRCGWKPCGYLYKQVEE